MGHEDRRPNAVNVRYWHLADIPETAINVRFRAKADIKEMSANDPNLTSGLFLLCHSLRHHPSSENRGNSLEHRTDRSS